MKIPQEIKIKYIIIVVLLVIILTLTYMEGYFRGKSNKICELEVDTNDTLSILGEMKLTHGSVMLANKIECKCEENNPKFEIK